MNEDYLEIAGRRFQSRLMIGTGKFPSATALREGHRGVRLGDRDGRPPARGSKQAGR